jgi:hypothetical protein
VYKITEFLVVPLIRHPIQSRFAAIGWPNETIGLFGSIC